MASRRDLLHRAIAVPAAAAAGAAVSAPSPAAAAGAEAECLSLRDPEFGAVGDGQADDSAAFDRWLAALQQRGRPGAIPAGRYRVPAVTPISTTGPLIIRGAGRDLAVLDGEGSVPNNIFNLRHSVSVDGVTFANWRRVFVISDGSDADTGHRAFPEHFQWTEDIGEFRLTGCAFRGTTQPVYFWSGGPYHEPTINTETEPTIHRIVLTHNIVERAWGGFYMAVLNLNDVWIEGNEFLDIDATEAGYNESGRAPLFGCAGQAVELGRDRGLYERTTGRFYIRSNVFRNILDRRHAASTGRFPEVQAINIVGATYFEIIGNHLENVYSDPPDVPPATVMDCEGIYLKAVHGKIAHNDLINCGRGEASINIKGSTYDSRGEIKQTGAGTHIFIHHNTLIWDHPTWAREVTAIRLGGDHHIVSNNFISGYGHPHSDYAPIYEPDQGARDNIVITDNIIRDSRFIHGIALRCGGSGRTIRGNIIDGLDGAGQDNDRDTVGILLRTRAEGVDMSDVLISENQVRRLTARPDRRTVGLQVWAHEAAFRDVVIGSNMLASGLDCGIHVRGMPCERVTIIGNHLAGAATPVDLGASVAGLVAHDNHGWLSAEARSEAFTIAGWGRARLRLPLPHARPGDGIRWAADHDLDGTLVSAQATGEGEVTLTLLNAAQEDLAIPQVTWSLSAVRHT